MMKRVLGAVTEALPDDDNNHLSRLDMHYGWGSVLNIRLYPTMPHSAAGREFGANLRGAVDDALGENRHSVEIVWEGIGR
jgi:hypothetical protein